MGLSDICDIKKQFAFYGSYHSNRINILIHIMCIPMIFWTYQVFLALIPMPGFVSSVQYTFGKYIVFDINAATVLSFLYFLYYLTLDPLAAATFAPQWALSATTATAFARHSSRIDQAVIVHVGSWIAQFIGHGFAEKRAPALLDNLAGALVLPPLFVHLEILFMAGYKPELHKQISNKVGKEITKFRKEQDEKRRAAQQKVQ